MPFSPKTPASMIGTFSAVLVFTMLKELFEDYYRMKSDSETNNRKTSVFNYDKQEFEDAHWSDIKIGDIVKVEKDHSFPGDLLFLYAKTDVIFVDTMNLDGETNLKPKILSSREMVNMIAYDKTFSNKKDEHLLPELSFERLKSLKGSVM